jgi:hypothetical protein
MELEHDYQYMGQRVSFVVMNHPYRGTRRGKTRLTLFLQLSRLAMPPIIPYFYLRLNFIRKGS